MRRPRRHAGRDADPAPLDSIRGRVIRKRSVAPSAAGRDDREVDPQAYLNTLHDSRRLIAAITLAITLLAGVYALSATPVYEANMLIHVEEDSPNASKNILSEVSSLFETKKAAIAEMELLRSRMVIARAVDNLRLDIDVRPRYFPVAGAWLAGRAGGRWSEPGLFGHGGYVWGAETIEVALFDVPAALRERDFRVTASGGGRFHLSGGGVAQDGAVGVPLRFDTAGGRLELRVSQLGARPGAQFILRRLRRLNVIERIQGALLITEQGKQSGVIEVRLQGEQPQLVHRILNEIGREYMRQNLARKTEEAEKSLAFLNTQLPELRRQLEQSEEKYNQFRHHHGTFDLGEEVRVSLQQSAAAKTRRGDLLQRKTELLTRFTAEHPVVLGVDQQLREVDDELRALSGHVKTLPLLERDEAKLTRDIKINTDLYTALSNTAQQLRVISVGKVSNVRLVDAPMVPEKPIGPRRALIIALAALTGLFLSVIVSFARKALLGGMDDPRQIEKLLGAGVVHATVCHSDEQGRLVRRGAAGVAPRVLAEVAPDDVAVESLRGFRAVLQFSAPLFGNNIVMFTGPTRGLGKSFISVNFAALVAAGGKRVLLIDADCRNGRLGRYFGRAGRDGASEPVGAAIDAEPTIERDVMPNLDFMSAGALPAHRSACPPPRDLGALLQALSARYDLVLIDSPPVLDVADALTIGRHAGAVFVVARAGVTTADELGESVNRLDLAGISPQGILFNDLRPRPGAYGYQSRYARSGRLARSSRYVEPG